MRAFILGGVVAAALVAPAMAADMPLKAPPPPPPVADWSGTYVGVNGGWGWAESHQFIPFAGAIVVDTGFYRQSGGLFGGTYGGNWEGNHVVLGYEGDFDWSHIDGNFSACLFGLGCNTNLRWFGTERLRGGYDFGGWMPYVTGGAIWGNLQAGIAGCTPPFCGSNNDAGWTVGAGVEWMFARNWSLKVEWLHYQFITNPYVSVAVPPTVVPVMLTERGDMVRAGINWHYDFFSFLK
jgi:outer membrane immunogenic protein